MKQLVITLGLFLMLFTQINAQKSLSEYAYVLVPQQFEFQRGIDQYQVNTLVRHLFREAGFNSIYDVELKGLPRCEGLFADLVMDSNLFQTTFTVVLKDCNNNVVYSSDPGTSKEKEYRKGYHQALRRAFRSIEILGVRQGDLDAFRESLEKRDAPIASPQKIEVKPVATPEVKIETSNLPSYTHEGTTYYLEAKDEGYVLYKESGEAILNAGTLSKTSRSGMYLFNQDGKSLLASFDADNNLIIDAEDSDGKPSQNVFLKVKQQ
jgi:hypothetical protein